LANRWVVTRAAACPEFALQALEPHVSARLLGLHVTAEGTLPGLEETRRGVAVGVSSRVLRPLRAVLKGRSLALRWAATAQPTALWGLELLRPCASRAARLGALQRRLFASALPLQPYEHEERPDFVRRRFRESGARLRSYGLRCWGDMQARLYFRLAGRLSSSSGAIRQLLTWRSLWWQRTHQALDGTCGGLRPGFPSRWENTIGGYFEARHQRDWLACHALYNATAEEEAFVQWALSPQHPS
jgi:hypothetical protein